MKNQIQGLEYVHNKLYFDSINLQELASKYSSPFFIYSKVAIQDNLQGYKTGAQNRKHLVCYSVKSNSNLSILKITKDLGCGADIVSGGELHRCKKAGVPTNKIVFSGVGKTQEEISQALKSDIMLFSVESTQELETIAKVAQMSGKKAPISIRVNPNVDAGTHPYISTGLSQNKFGISQEEILSLYKNMKESKWLEPVGIGFHIGSQLTSLDGFKEAAGKVSPLIREILSMGIKLQFIDCGGGLGIHYHADMPQQIPTAREYVEMMMQELPFEEQTLLFEPGRSIVGNAGILIGKTLYTKKNNTKHFTIVDIAMNDIIRPALYEGHHEILPLLKKPDSPVINTDIVGPVCESGDFIAKDRNIQEMKQGDSFAVLSAGAYCFSMSSNYNTRPRAWELLIESGGTVKVIRKQESLEDLTRLEEECL